MSDYHYPGVYVEELPAPSVPIAGVSTSTAGFIGIAADLTPMPTSPSGTAYKICPPKTPVAITSWDKFGQFFGKVSTENKCLALSVFNFFNNGGTRCWVARIATTASIDTDLDACLKGFAAIDEISMVAVPLFSDAKHQLNPMADAPVDPFDTVHKKLIAHCETLKDRIAILDWDNTDPTQIPTNNLPASQDGYAALYVPWISVPDPSASARSSLCLRAVRSPESMPARTLSAVFTRHLRMKRSTG